MFSEYDVALSNNGQGLSLYIAVSGSRLTVVAFVESWTSLICVFVVMDGIHRLCAQRNHVEQPIV